MVSHRIRRLPKDRDVIGPVRPRLQRIRTKRWGLPIGANGTMHFLINRPPPAHEGSGSPTHGGLRDAYMVTEDTIPNPVYTHRHGRPRDDGGMFLSQQSWWRHQTFADAGNWAWGTRAFGTYWCNVNDPYHDGMFVRSAKFAPASDYTDVPSYGPTGFARARPDRSLFNYGQSVVEARDIPRMLKPRVEQFKDIADYYVGVEFGWKPVLSDIKKMYHIGDRLNRIVAAIHRNNGKPVRRTARVLHSVDTQNLFDYQGSVGTVYNGKALFGHPASWYTHPYWTLNFRKTRDIWFSGSFIDWVDDIDIPEYDFNIKAKLLGFKITPKLVWDLMPWSWLIDWFSNVGDVLSNYSSTWADREVAEYAYIMGSTTREYTWTGSDGHALTWSKKTFTTKCRYAADRFGLQNTADLSPTQIAILIALGIARVGF